MKKLVFLLSALFLLGGCSQEFVRESSYTPTGGADYNPALDPEYKPPGQGGEEQGGEEGGQGGGEVTPEEEDVVEGCIYNFYFSYSHSTKYNPITKKDENSPIYSWEQKDMLKAIGAVPSALADTSGKVDVEKVKYFGGLQGFTPDPAFPKFMGFSFHGICLDVEDIWDFTKDYKQQAEISLYGVWYSDAI